MKSENPEGDGAGGEGLITDPSSLKPGDRVVYPNQGVCRVTGAEVQEIAGQKLELVRMVREEDGAAVMVPRAKLVSVGLRRVASRRYVEGVFHFLAAQADDPELDWKIRHRDNADRLVTGGVLGVAEVVKGLHALSRIRPLPTKEREQYDGSRHLLVAEVAVALGVPPAVAEDYVDFALVPPAGVTFKLKPPPKPVELPVRLARRRPVVKTEDDLGLDDLGLDLAELGEAAVEAGGEKGEGAEEAAGAEGAGEGAAGEAQAEEEPARPEPAGKGKAARRAEPRKAAARPERKPARAAAPKKAAPKAAQKKAAKKPARKPARGGRK